MRNLRLYVAIGWVVLNCLFLVFFAGMFVVYCPTWAGWGVAAFISLRMIDRTMDFIHGRLDQEAEKVAGGAQ